MSLQHYRPLIRLGVVLSLIAFSFLALLPAHAQGCTTYHTVQVGENLFRIGLKYGVSYTVIAQANGIANASVIYPGQRLCIPAGGAYAGTSTTTTTTTTTTSTTTTTTGTTGTAGTTGHPGTTTPTGNWLDALKGSGWTAQYPPDLLAQIPGYSPLFTDIAPPGHQIALWPQYGWEFDYESIWREPAVQIWSFCQPEMTLYDLKLVCSKSGLGWFFSWDLVDPATTTTTATTTTCPC